MKASLRPILQTVLTVFGYVGIIMGVLILAYLITDQLIPTISITIIALGLLLTLLVRQDILKAHLVLPTAQWMTPSNLLFIAWVLPTTWLLSQITAYAAYFGIGSQAFESMQTHQKTDYQLHEVLFSNLIGSPVIEEALFRVIVFGLLFETLRRVITPQIAFLISASISALSFSLFHGNLVQISLTLAPGILFCALYAITGNMWSAIGSHSIYNALSWLIPLQGMQEFLAPISPLVLIPTMILLLVFNVAFILKLMPTRIAL